MKKIIYYSLLVIFIIIFIYSSFNINKQNNDLTKKIRLNNYYATINKNSYKYINILDEYRSKYHNTDIVGIINIDSLDISSLIMQSRDNNYYLNHLENKDTSIYGSIMLDYRNNLFNDKINIIYGHTSNTDITPFKKLEKYLDYNFYKDNKYIEIIDDYRTYKYEIFSIAKIDKNEYRHLNIDLDNNDYLEQLNYYKDISIYDDDINLNSSDKVLILQTCLNNSNNFILVIAKLINY